MRCRELAFEVADRVERTGLHPLAQTVHQRTLFTETSLVGTVLSANRLYKYYPMHRKTDCSHRLTRYLIALAALLTLAGHSHAQEQSIEQTIATCQGCHGADGVPVSADIPILAGQEYYYLYVQLKDYKAGLRANPIMSGMVQNLSKDDMKALAQHFSEKPWPRVADELDDSKAAMGKSALAAGQCSQCHSTYQGDSRVPRLAGQHVAYLLQTMQDFKHKVRKNSPAKGSLMGSFSEEDLKAMAHYLAGL